LFFPWQESPPPCATAASLSRLHDHTQESQHSVGLFWTIYYPTKRPLPDNTQHTHNRQTNMPLQDSNPHSQQVSGRRPTSQTARPLGSAPWLSSVCLIMYIPLHSMELRYFFFRILISKDYNYVIPLHHPFSSSLCCAHTSSDMALFSERERSELTLIQKV